MNATRSFSIRKRLRRVRTIGWRIHAFIWLETAAAKALLGWIPVAWEEPLVVRDA